MKQELLIKLLEDEGGYVNHKDDNGGSTKYGVTQAVAKQVLGKDAKDITWDEAIQVAENQYWEPLQLDSILSIAGSELTFKLLTVGFNMGTSKAGKFLQRVLNALTKDNLLVDGVIGTNTINSLQGYMNHRNDSEALVKYVTSLQGAFYIELCERNTKYKSFSYGWSKRL